MKKKIYLKPSSNVIRLNIKDQLLDNNMLETVTKEMIRVRRNTRCLMKRMAGVLSQNHTVLGTIKFETSKLKTIQ